MGYNISYTATGDKVRYINLIDEITETELYEIVGLGAFDRIQCNFIPSTTSLELLNLYYSQFPQTGFRLFGGRLKESIDVSFLSSLPAVRKLAIDDSWGRITEAAAIGQLRELESIEITARAIDNFDFINELPNTTRKFVCETKAKNLDLSSLCRVPNLKTLGITGYKKNIEAIAELLLLEDLQLKGITLDSLDFINRMTKMSILKIEWGSITDYSALYGNPQIKALRLFRINNFTDTNLLTSLPSLQAVELSWLKHIESLPDLSKHKHLRHVSLDTMKSLTDLSGLECVESLGSVSFFSCPSAFEPENILPVLRNSSVQQCSFYTSSQKKNDRISELILKSGKRDKHNSQFITEMLYPELYE